MKARYSYEKNKPQASWLDLLYIQYIPFQWAICQATHFISFENLEVKASASFFLNVFPVALHGIAWPVSLMWRQEQRQFRRGSCLWIVKAVLCTATDRSAKCTTEIRGKRITSDSIISILAFFSQGLADPKSFVSAGIK